MPERGLCGDNGAMIAAAGYYRFLDGVFADTSLNASASDDGL
jgi:N6-L-threonylcarbamoyladenine synthase